MVEKAKPKVLKIGWVLVGLFEDGTILKVIWGE